MKKGGLPHNIHVDVVMPKTSEEAKILYCKAKENSDKEEIYWNLWNQLADAEAPQKAKACKTAAEAEKLHDESIEGSRARKIYLRRLIKLHFSEKGILLPSKIKYE